MSTGPGDKIRRIAAFHGFEGADDAAPEDVALWIARRFQLLSEHATDVISVHDAEGRIEYVSPSASRSSRSSIWRGFWTSSVSGSRRQ